MEQLPDEIMKKIVGYASPFDIIALSKASKTLHSQLALSVTPPRHVLSELSKPDFPIPRFQEPIHSIVITVQCQDSLRRRKRRGKAYVVDEEKQHVYSAVRIRQRHRIMFQPNQNESYHLQHSYGAETSFQVKQQTLSFGVNGNFHHFLVKYTTDVDPQLLDEAMGRANETADDPFRSESETTDYC